MNNKERRFAGRVYPLWSVLIFVGLFIGFAFYQSQHAFADGSNTRNPSLYVGLNNPAVDTMTISTDETITDLDLYVNIPHTYIGDLEIDLEHVDTGTSVRVWDQNCGGDSDIVTTFSDEGDALVCPPGATTIPVNALSAFDGESSAGDWELTVTDTAGADNGTLVSWQLDWTNQPNAVTIKKLAARSSPFFAGAMAIIATAVVLVLRRKRN